MRSVVFLDDEYHMMSHAFSNSIYSLHNNTRLETQLTLITERKRERFIYFFFRARAERKKSSVMKGLRANLVKLDGFIQNQFFVTIV